MVWLCLWKMGGERYGLQTLGIISSMIDLKAHKVSCIYQLCFLSYRFLNPGSKRGFPRILVFLMDCQDILASRTKLKAWIFMKLCMNVVQYHSNVSLKGQNNWKTWRVSGLFGSWFQFSAEIGHKNGIKLTKLQMWPLSFWVLSYKLAELLLDDICAYPVRLSPIGH